MTRFCLWCVVCLALVACSERAGPSKGETPTVEPAAPAAPAVTVDHKQVAENIVGKLAMVKEGDLVAVYATVDDVELLDEITMAVMKRGGHVLPVVKRPHLSVRYYKEVPERYDVASVRTDLEVAKIIDVRIDVGESDPALRNDLPPKRLAAASEAWMKEVDKVLNERHVRRLQLGNGLYPVAGMARRHKMTRAELAKIFWSGVGVDPAQLQRTGEELRTAMGEGKELHLTTPAGTDLKMKIEGRPTMVVDGAISEKEAEAGGPVAEVWLPAGEAILAPVPGTAEGTVVAERVPYAGGEIKNLKVTFVKGKMTAFGADPSEAFDRWKADFEAAAERKDEFALVDVGLNPAVSEEKLLTWVRSGMVTVGIGFNEWAQGGNANAYGSYWHLPKSTLKVDGKPVVENGELTP